METGSRVSRTDGRTLAAPRYDTMTDSRRRWGDFDGSGRTTGCDGPGIMVDNDLGVFTVVSIVDHNPLSASQTAISWWKPIPLSTAAGFGLYGGVGCHYLGGPIESHHIRKFLYRSLRHASGKLQYIALSASLYGDCKAIYAGRWSTNPRQMM